MYENIGTDEREIVIARFGSIVRKITASYESKAIYGEKRQEVTDILRPTLKGWAT
ncbi:MAG: hypothetical protein EBE86_014730 [Hormoscilla sp. GUM202]|nr:hypothetical protein [Hormoscilla sp. GUM202]